MMKRKSVHHYNRSSIRAVGFSETSAKSKLSSRTKTGFLHSSLVLTGKRFALRRHVEIDVQIDSRGELSLANIGREVRVSQKYNAALRSLAESGPVQVPFSLHRPDRHSKTLIAVPLLKKFRPRMDFRLFETPEKPTAKRIPHVAPLPPRRGYVIVQTKAKLAPVRERPAKDSKQTLREDKHPTMVTAEGFMRAMDPAIVIDAVRRVAAGGQSARIVCLANVLHAIDLKVGGERALAYYEKILPVSDAVEFGEFKPILLQESAKVAHRLGRTESAASYALGAIRNALDSGERVIAANLMRQAESLEIL